MTQAPSATVFDFMKRGQIKEFHEVFGRYIDWCAAQGLPQAASEPTNALDAARYRYLRGRCDDCAVELSFSPSVEKGWITVQQNNDQGPALDAAIDAAMAERPAEGGSKT